MKPEVSEASNREKLAFGVALAAIVVVPGLSAALVHSLGYETLGTVTWVVGYGSGVLTIWYVWIRPLDLHSPAGSSVEETDRDG